MSELLTTRVVAEDLGVIPRRVRALVEAGKLRAYKVGGVLLVDGESLARLKAEREQNQWVRSWRVEPWRRS